MLIIGEKLNSSIKKTLDALISHDEEYIINLIKLQVENGAEYLDINTALTGDDELQKMIWVCGLVAENSDCGVMIDSSNPEILERCIPLINNKKIIVNSISFGEKYEGLIGLVKERNIPVVCLPVRDNRIPQTADDRVENITNFILQLKACDIPEKNIFTDVLVEAVATNETAAVTTLETIRRVKQAFPNVNTVCGLSNISFGLPKRAELNASFLAMALQCGLDAAIIDITSKLIKSTLFASDALLGKDEYCLEYIGYARSQM